MRNISASCCRLWQFIPFAYNVHNCAIWRFYVYAIQIYKQGIKTQYGRLKRCCAACYAVSICRALCSVLSLYGSVCRVSICRYCVIASYAVCVLSMAFCGVYSIDTRAMLFRALWDVVGVFCRAFCRVCMPCFLLTLISFTVMQFRNSLLCGILCHDAMMQFCIVRIPLEHSRSSCVNVTWREVIRCISQSDSQSNSVGRSVGTVQKNVQWILALQITTRS